MSRILFASHPFDGHFNPLTRLATHLKARGHDVRWYTASIYAEQLARLGIAHYPFVRAKEITADNLTEHFPEYDTKPMDGKTACEFFFAPIERNYRDLCDIHANFPFDALICDAALHMSRIVAEKLPAKVYVVAPAPTPAPTSPTAPAPFFGFKPARSVLGRFRDRAVTRLLASTMKQGVAMFSSDSARGSHRVPLLCAGKLEGKADINARLDYRGLAVDLRTERPTKGQIGKAAVRVLGDPRYAERVRKLQMELCRYRPCEIVEQKLNADGLVVA